MCLRSPKEECLTLSRVGQEGAGGYPEDNACLESYRMSGNKAGEMWRKGHCQQKDAWVRDLNPQGCRLARTGALEVCSLHQPLKTLMLIEV